VNIALAGVSSRQFFTSSTTMPLGETQLAARIEAGSAEGGD
jgi:hypothetical protein